ncbi:gas vesicle protein G [Mycobacterium sp. B14F4]|uniref:gas vesicle protein GvpG n=1 Tax=Mycobacterium sp. B14F4 TaxID=3153565 RepID=UPI00325C8CA6
MGIFSSLFLLPLAPVRGVVALGELIQRQVDLEVNDPARTRRMLEDLEEASSRGEVSPEQERQAQKEILKSRISPGTAGNTPHEDG